MKKTGTILLTGAAGFIGSYMLGYLNKQGYTDILIVDDFSERVKEPNYKTKTFSERIEREQLFEWLTSNNPNISFVLHLGARTDTTEFDYAIHERLNVVYSKRVWDYCVEKGIPLIYASSAATYGSGELGYKDDHALAEKLKPLNPYGVSKNEFDKWAIQQTATPSFWAGLKFFNVYGPNEYHKERMASVVLHAFNQIQTTGKVKLFRSHRPEFKDGEQLRDFIYVEDLARVMLWMMEEVSAGSKKISNGLYNLGTGRARTFIDLVTPIFHALSKTPQIEFIDTPEDIRNTYQYFTEAEMGKLRSAGYTKEFYSVEEGVTEYTSRFLVGKGYY
jgi:ADP-L-glycero-D-manno-heptose 6-epimerase